MRHCRDIHVMKQTPKFIPPEIRSKNYTPGRHAMNVGLGFGTQPGTFIIQQPGQQFGKSTFVKPPVCKYNPHQAQAT